MITLGIDKFFNTKKSTPMIKPASNTVPVPMQIPKKEVKLVIPPAPKFGSSTTKTSTTKAATAAPVSAPVYNGGGGGGYSAPATKLTSEAPKLLGAADLAKMYGINYDYDYILNMLNEGSDAYLKQSTEQANALQASSLRAGADQYSQYLKALRDNKANAVSSGINRGAASAQDLISLLGAQQTQGDVQTELNTKVLDLVNLATTEKAKNKSTALTNYNALGQYLGTLGSNLNANDVQRYASDLASNASAYAADRDLQAAGVTAAATRAAGNSQLDVLKYLMANQDDPYVYKTYIAPMVAQSKLNSEQAAKLAREK